MQNGLGLIALVVAASALAVAGLQLFADRTDAPDALADRVQSLEDQVALLEQALEERRVSETGEPLLAGGAPGLGLPMPHPGAQAGEVGTRADGAPAAETVGTDALARPEAEAGIEELVEQAVEKKAAQLRQMRNKKPSIDAFAEVLELTEAQRQAAEAEVLRGQREIEAVLLTPTEDGTIFMDELVEVLANGLARPGKNGPQWQKLFGRLLSEKVPGTDQTYAEQAEAVKQTVRDAFRRDWSEKQYATFEAWQMDPTEVQQVEGSPWKQIEGRVKERARDLGAKIPDDDR